MHVKSEPSAFWLGWRCILGLAASSKTAHNMMLTSECVLNLPSVKEVAAIDRLARTTGSNPVPESKMRKGYRHEFDKFGIAALTPAVSETVGPPRVRECPVQLEAIVEATHRIAEKDSRQSGNLVCIEVRIQRVQVEESILMSGESNPRVQVSKPRC